MGSDTTVLVPFLRGGRRDWLQDCLGSFPDGTPRIVAENDGEMAEALNAGLAKVETPYVMVFGADDIASTTLLPMLESLIWDVDVVYPTMILTDENLNTIGSFPAQAFDGNRLLQWNFVTGGFLARTDKLREVGGWRDLESLEDWDLHVRMFRSGARFKPVPEAVFLYRQVPGSRNKQAYYREEWQKRIVGEVPRVDATFYYQATPATTYWRCQLPARYLPGRALAGFEMSLTEDEVDFPDHQGVAVFQFPGDKSGAFSAFVALPSLGYRVLLEADDSYLSTMPHRKRQGWGTEIGKDQFTYEGHKWIAGRADGVIVATKTLADRYAKVNSNVFICRNSIDPSDWPEIVKPDDGVFRIGWFASLSHQEDADLVRRALEWASAQKDVEVVTMGFDPGWRFPRRHIPWSNDLATYWKNMGCLDVGVAPVVPSPWAVCRSDLKALEYSMAGACSVLSDQPPYAEWDDTRCLKAGSAKDFYNRMKWLVQNRDQAKELAESAKQYVLAERSFPGAIDQWKAAIDV